MTADPLQLLAQAAAMSGDTRHSNRGRNKPKRLGDSSDEDLPPTSGKGRKGDSQAAGKAPASKTASKMASQQSSLAPSSSAMTGQSWGEEEELAFITNLSKSRKLLNNAARSMRGHQTLSAAVCQPLYKTPWLQCNPQCWATTLASAT